MNATHVKNQQKARRAGRTRARIAATHTEKPRLSVHKSNKYISAQLIDDAKAHTLAAGTTKTISAGTPLEKAKELGLMIAKKAKDAKVERIVFDRGSYAYMGQVKALAEGAREGGLQF